MSNRILVLTALLGDKNPKLPSFKKHKNCDYIMISDNHSNPLWEIVKPNRFSMDDGFKDRRDAKIYKVLPNLFWPDYDYYIWHDCTSWLEADPNEFIEKYIGDSDFLNFRHPYRGCVYQEVQENINNKFDYAVCLDAFVNFLKTINYPENNGLYENTAFVRKNTDKANAVCMTWWELICKFSSRDQLSLPLAYYYHKVEPSILLGSGQSYGGNNKFIPSLETTLNLDGRKPEISYPFEPKAL